MSIADRFVTEIVPAWFRRQNSSTPVIQPNSKKNTRRQAVPQRPTVAFKPKPVNPDRYSTHL